MSELVKFLNQINNREIPASSVVSPDLLALLKLTGNKSVDRDAVRQYLVSQDLYLCEEDIDIFMRDLYTVRVVLHETEHRNKLESLVKSTLKVGEGRITVNDKIVRELIQSGFKCYPVMYDKEGDMILGIITNIGHIVVA